MFNNVATGAVNCSLTLRGFEALNKFLKALSSYARSATMALSGLMQPAESVGVLNYLNSKSCKLPNIAKFKFKR